MKTLLLFLITACTLVSCRKEIGACKDYKEDTGRSAGEDPANVDYQPFRDTLAKYPELHLLSYWKNPDNRSMSCEVYYNDLLLVNYNYWISIGPNGQTNVNGRVLRNPTYSNQVTVSKEDAIEVARKHINLDFACVNYRLVLVDVGSSSRSELRYAWKISKRESIYYFVVIDAATKKVHMVNGGWWVN